MAWTVVVRRQSDGWHAEIVDLAVALRAFSLSTLDRRVRERLGSQGPEYHFRTGDAELDRLVGEVREARRSARLLQDLAREAVYRAIVRGGGMSRRDLALLLGLSHQR